VAGEGLEEGEKIAGILMATLDAAELTPEQWERARGTMRRELMALTQGPLGDVVEGEEIVMEKLREQETKT